eukprot:TRINITY_DN38695_c0_g1_i1.p1 TRINITY_DN38695_c0_g1~~TRINITY_DN38695_c0_g1_i1.p1  ORF type:complete len:1072 (+),score=303.20 TRINITY_DN38695_c0_g1_i1:76-3291(+)
MVPAEAAEGAGPPGVPSATPLASGVPSAGAKRPGAPVTPLAAKRQRRGGGTPAATPPGTPLGPAADSTGRRVVATPRGSSGAAGQTPATPAGDTAAGPSAGRSMRRVTEAAIQEARQRAADAPRIAALRSQAAAAKSLAASLAAGTQSARRLAEIAPSWAELGEVLCTHATALTGLRPHQQGSPLEGGPRAMPGPYPLLRLGALLAPADACDPLASPFARALQLAPAARPPAAAPPAAPGEEQSLPPPIPAAADGLGAARERERAADRLVAALLRTGMPKGEAVRELCGLLSAGRASELRLLLLENARRGAAYGEADGWEGALRDARAFVADHCPAEYLLAHAAALGPSAHPGARSPRRRRREPSDASGDDSSAEADAHRLLDAAHAAAPPEYNVLVPAAERPCAPETEGAPPCGSRYFAQAVSLEPADGLEASSPTRRGAAGHDFLPFVEEGRAAGQSSPGRKRGRPAAAGDYIAAAVALEQRHAPPPGREATPTSSQEAAGGSQPQADAAARRAAASEVVAVLKQGVDEHAGDAALWARYLSAFGRLAAELEPAAPLAARVRREHAALAAARPPPVLDEGFCKSLLSGAAAAPEDTPSGAAAELPPWPAAAVRAAEPRGAAQLCVAHAAALVRDPSLFAVDAAAAERGACRALGAAARRLAAAQSAPAVHKERAPGSAGTQRDAAEARHANSRALLAVLWHATLCNSRVGGERAAAKALWILMLGRDAHGKDRQVKEMRAALTRQHLMNLAVLCLSLLLGAPPPSSADAPAMLDAPLCLAVPQWVHTGALGRNGEAVLLRWRRITNELAQEDTEGLLQQQFRMLALALSGEPPAEPEVCGEDGAAALLARLCGLGHSDAAPGGAGLLQAVDEWVTRRWGAGGAGVGPPALNGAAEWLMWLLREAIQGRAERADVLFACAHADAAQQGLPQGEREALAVSHAALRLRLGLGLAPALAPLLVSGQPSGAPAGWQWAAPTGLPRVVAAALRARPSAAQELRAADARLAQLPCVRIVHCLSRLSAAAADSGAGQEAAAAGADAALGELAASHPLPAAVAGPGGLIVAPHPAAP